MHLGTLYEKNQDFSKGSTQTKRKQIFKIGKQIGHVFF